MNQTAADELLTVETKGLLFDMDGVLISSTGSVERSWQRWCRHYQMPNADQFQVPHGTRAVDIVRTLKPEWDEAQVAAGQRLIEDLELADTADLIVLPGVKLLLERLPPERWAVVSSASTRVLIGRLEAAGLPVPPRFISGDMVVRGKPDAEPYRRGAELLGFAPKECIVVEDAPSGVGSGVAAGCRVLAVLLTHPAEALRAATWLARSLEAVAVTAKEDGLELRFRPVDV
ncbi:MAG TPA: HAD-IA family hydrolase [Acidobacteriaceae bacterium]|nr:HAD-IA family hydrolase [Acidobacteriaceae bacterium]